MIRRCLCLISTLFAVLILVGFFIAVHETEQTQSAQRLLKQNEILKPCRSPNGSEDVGSLLTLHKESVSPWFGALSQNADLDASDGWQLCTQIISGTWTFVVDISNPNGVGGIANYQSSSFVQEVTSQTPTTTRVQIQSILQVDTRTHFPVGNWEFPTEIQTYLQPSYSIQSDHPEIVGQAQQLVSGLPTQVQAVEKVLDWVLASISYDYSISLPNDALSVFHNRSGVCGGFSNLGVALLRAAGIPARRVIGFIPPGHMWGSNNEGGWHSWIEVYYLDVGWVYSEPQGEKNVVDPYHIFGGCDQCGQSDTSYETVSDTVWALEVLYAVGSSYTNSVHGGATAAYVPGWDRLPFRVVPEEMAFLITLDGQSIHEGSLRIQDINACGDLAWWAVDCSDWLTVEPMHFITNTVRVTVDPQGLSLGEYSGHITTTALGGGAITELVIPVRLLIVDQIYRVHLPAIFRSQATE